jgi:hypothetical protein
LESAGEISALKGLPGTEYGGCLCQMIPPVHVNGI